MSDDLTAFIAARLDEDEAISGNVRGAETWADDVGGVFDADERVDWFPHVARYGPARALREVAAKRKTLARHTRVRSSGRAMCGNCLGSCTFWPCPDLRDLAAIWSDHQDYRPEWAPAR